MDIILTLIISGVLFLVLLIWLIRRYTIQSYVAEKSFDETQEALLLEIDKAGWKLIASHNIQEKLVGAGYDFKKISVIEICRPDYAAAVLEKDSNKRFSSLMPCRISLYELDKGRTGMAMINAGLLSALFGGVILQVMGRAAKESEAIIRNTINN